MRAPADHERRGVAFPVVDGRRGSTPTGRAVLTDAAAAVDAGLAARVSAERDWRRGYVRHVRDLVAATTRADAAVAAARAGLESVQARLVVLDGVGAETPLYAAAGREPATPLATFDVSGTGARETQLALPVDGRRLAGEDLLARVGAWEQAGVLEPSAAAAVADVVAHPEWLDLRGRSFGLLGAAAELAPLEPLLSWGATVYAVDLPRPAAWRAVLDVARASAGRLHAPVHDTDAPPATGCGVDLLADPAAVRQWLAAAGQPLTVGSYVYADGAAFPLVAMAADAVAARLQAEGRCAGTAVLATPTDAFVVPPEAVAAARDRYARRGWRRPVQTPMHVLSAGRLFRPQYADTAVGTDGREVAVHDCLVPQQGPNYALAKQAQRWRAVVSAADGLSVSANVAPPTRTRSVLRNPVLARAYTGARRFGVEVFAPATARTLMAALLVHDLHALPPGSLQGHDLHARGAVHGGLWRVAYEPRSVLGLAVAAGTLTR